MPENGARTRSDILYQIRPTFFEGMARAFDLFGTMPVRRCSDSSPDANTAAIHGDWMTIGDDLRKVMIDFERENGVTVLDRLEGPGGERTDRPATD